MSHNGEEARSGEDFRDIMSHISKRTNAATVYAEPTVLGDHAVIPVAQVRYRGGGGYGGGQGPMTARDETAYAEGEESLGSGQGMGLGFSVSAKPIGALEVTPEGVHWSPAFDWGRIIQIWSVITGFVVMVAAVKVLMARH